MPPNPKPPRRKHPLRRWLHRSERHLIRLLCALARWHYRTARGNMP